MIAENCREFQSLLAPKKALLGFDFGTKRLGVAVSDPMRTIATPVKIIQRESFAKDLAEIRRLVADREIGGIVYGLPLKMNGQEGDTATLVRAFAQKLDDHINLPYTFWDERLSSSAVESFLINNADMSRNKRKQVLDASAAAYILQGFLDSLKYL